MGVFVNKFVKDIVNDVSDKYSISPDDIFGTCKNWSSCVARSEVYYKIRSTGKLSYYTYGRIGQIFNRSRITVSDSVKRYCRSRNIPVPKTEFNWNCDIDECSGIKVTKQSKYCENHRGTRISGIRFYNYFNSYPIDKENFCE